MQWGRPKGETVRDYTIEFFDISGSVTTLEVTGNYLRRRQHALKVSRPVKTMRIHITQTNGLDHARIVDFQVDEVGMPREFLEGYTRERLERQEMLLFEEGSQLVSAGELRRDREQKGIAHLGMIVCRQERRKGVGSRMLASLVTRSREQGLRPYCSTELSNLGARRAIEWAGFRASHRVLSVTFAL